MSSCFHAGGLPAFQAPPFSLDEPLSVVPLPGVPLLATAVPAGFPSPADDHVEGRIDLNEHLIAHKEATFFVRVAGESMVGFGIHHGDLLVVDRAIDAVDRSVVIAVVDGDFTVKQLCLIPNGVLLRSGSATHSDIFVGEEQTLLVWGVVRWSIHQVWSCPETSR